MVNSATEISDAAEGMENDQMTSLSVKIGDQAQTESDHHVTILRARSGWQLIDFREIWHFRDLLWVLALRDIQVRYKQAVLGILWAVIQPVATVAIFGVVFGELLGVSKKVPEVNGQVPPYAVYLFAAQLPWLFFQSSVNTSSNSLVANANMLRKIYLPKLLIPLSALGAPLIDFALGFVVFVGVMVYYDVSFNLQMLMLPLLLISVILVSAGVGIMLSALTVTYRDFRYVVPFMMQSAR